MNTSCMVANMINYELFLFPTLFEEKRGLCSSARPAHNSATIGPIHSKSSSLELPKPLDVHRHGHLATGGHIGVLIVVIKVLDL